MTLPLLTSLVGIDCQEAKRKENERVSKNCSETTMSVILSAAKNLSLRIVEMLRLRLSMTMQNFNTL